VFGAVLMLGLATSPGSAAAPARQVQGLHLAQPGSVCSYSQHALDRMHGVG
jgi:hypothetical protein